MKRAHEIRMMANAKFKIEDCRYIDFCQHVSYPPSYSKDPKHDPCVFYILLCDNIRVTHGELDSYKPLACNQHQIKRGAHEGGA